MKLEDQYQFSAQAVGLFGAPADLALHCDRCAWWLHIAEPISLADLIGRAEQHTEAHHA